MDFSIPLLVLCGHNLASNLSRHIPNKHPERIISLPV